MVNETSSTRLDVLVLDSRKLICEGLSSLLGESSEIVVRVSSELPEAGVRPAIDVIIAGDVAPPPAPVPVVHLASCDTLTDLVAAIHSAAVGEPASSDAASTAPRSTGGLTLRERTVLTMVGTGRSATEIGRELGISPRTVERHKQSLTAKLGATNAAHALAMSLAEPLTPDVG